MLPLFKLPTQTMHAQRAAVRFHEGPVGGHRADLPTAMAGRGSAHKEREPAREEVKQAQANIIRRVMRDNEDEQRMTLLTCMLTLLRLPNCTFMVLGITRSKNLSPSRTFNLPCTRIPDRLCTSIQFIGLVVLERPRDAAAIGMSGSSKSSSTAVFDAHIAHLTPSLVAVLASSVDVRSTIRDDCCCIPNDFRLLTSIVNCALIRRHTSRSRGSLKMWR